MPKQRVQRVIDEGGSRRSGSSVSAWGGGGAGVSAHSALAGLDGDDHLHYLTVGRGDLRYPLLTTYGAHVADPDAHHVRLHALDSAGDHSGTLSWGKVDKTGSSLADLPARLYADLQTRAHLVTGADHTITAAQYGVVGATATDTLGVLTPSADVSAGATALLRSNAGALAVGTLTAGTKVRTSLLDSATGLIAVGASANLRADNYASQTTGWAVDYNGSGDFRYLYTGEMHAKTFIADLEQALAGGQIISKSVAVLAQDITLPAAGAAEWVYVESLPSAPGMDVFEAGDVLRLRSFSRAGGGLTVADCWGVVRKNAGEPYYSTNAEGKEVQQWHFTRSAAPDAGSASGTIKRGTLVLDYGTTGNGYYEVNAIDGLYAVNSPYSQVVTWTTHPHSGKSVRVRLGNLEGVVTGAGYGLWAGDATYGNILVTGDGVKLRQGTTDMIVLSGTAGDSYFAGAMTLGTDGGIYQGSGDFATPGTGLKLWQQDGVGRIGGYNAGTLQWHGNTDGKFYFAGVKGQLSDAGIMIDVAAVASAEEVYSYKFSTSGVTVGGLYGTSGHELYLLANKGATDNPYIGITAAGDNGVDGTIGAVSISAIGKRNALINLNSSLSLSSVAISADALDFDGNATLDGTLGVTGATTLSSTLQTGIVTVSNANPGIKVGLAAALSTGDAYIALGDGRTGDGHCYITFDADSDSAYETRVIRWAGVDGAFDIVNRGTGLFSLTAEGGAAMRFLTTNTERMRILAGGNVGIGTSSPTELLHVNGTVLAADLRGRLRLGAGTVPTTGGDATGSVGDLVWSAANGYMYLKIADSGANRWRRIALTTF